MGRFGDPTSQRYRGGPPASRMCGGEPPNAREQGVTTSVKELGLVDVEEVRGLAEAPVASDCARGLGTWHAYRFYASLLVSSYYSFSFFLDMKPQLNLYVSII
jgi:hypothetical protein